MQKENKKASLFKTSFPFVFSSLIRTFNFIESTLVRKSSNIIWLFAHLLVPLQIKYNIKE